MTEYRNIKFEDGDLITVKAGSPSTSTGCVQTGGHGLTWKRYVDPSGYHNAEFYHGLIWVPGATLGLQRIETYNNKSIYVKTCGRVKANGMFLRLGYEDDHYLDNGFYDHDDGTEDQCKNSVNAFIDLDIEHHGLQPVGDPPAPVDLEKPDSCEGYDPNVLPLNPRWGWQRTHPPELPSPGTMCNSALLFEDPACSTQHPAFDLPTGTNSVACGTSERIVPGHVNYFNAVYTGSIAFDAHTGGLLGDDDYNFLLTPPKRQGLTVKNDQAIGVEFDSDETIDYFDTPWWNAFHAVVDIDPSNELARRMVHENQAIVAGLVGLDCQHDCMSEIHPVFALAMRVASNIISSEPYTVEETWAMFIRNTGDEGFCSSQKHHLYLPDDTFSFVVPIGSDSYEVTRDSVFKGNNNESGWSVAGMGHSAVKVSFLLPENQASTMINGELHIRWTRPRSGEVPTSTGDTTQEADARRKLETNESTTIETRLDALSSGLTKEQLEYYRKQTKTRRKKDALTVPMVADLSRLRDHSKAKAYVDTTGLRDGSKEARDRKKFDLAIKLLGAGRK